MIFERIVVYAPRALTLFEKVCPDFQQPAGASKLDQLLVVDTNFSSIVPGSSRRWILEHGLTYPATHYRIEEYTSCTNMDLEDQLRSLEERYDISESERAREFGRTVAQLRD